MGLILSQSILPIKTQGCGTRVPGPQATGLEESSVATRIAGIVSVTASLTTNFNRPFHLAWHWLGLVPSEYALMALGKYASSHLFATRGSRPIGTSLSPSCKGCQQNRNTCAVEKGKLVMQCGVGKVHNAAWKSLQQRQRADLRLSSSKINRGDGAPKPSIIIDVESNVGRRSIVP